MRNRVFAFAIGLVALAGCTTDPSSPRTSSLADESLDLIPDYAISPAAVIDGAGVGAAMLPPELALSADQKAAIAALHKAFMDSHAADLAALRELERQIREARKHGATRDQLRPYFEQARAIQERLAADFAKLQEAIWQVYTPEQRAWIESHRPRICGPAGPPRLTDAQVAQIRALREAFVQAIAADLTLIKQVHEQAQAARQAGKPRAEIEAILATARPALDRVRAAERKLHEDIMAVLTPEQRAAWCVVRHRVAPPGPRNG